jgi:hypothetical protein
MATLAMSIVFGIGSAHAVQVYSQNFEGGPLGAEWSGAGSIQSSQGLSAFGFGSQHLKNDGASASVLSLTGLASHTEMTLGFSLAMWDSIDFGDTFQVNSDVGFLINGPFGNYFTPGGQSEGPGTLLTEPFTAFAVPNYGSNAGFRDSARAVSVTFAHSASTANFSFQYPNTQGGSDESFGIDNVVVTTNASGGHAVPEPASLSLMGLGLAGLAATRFHKKG